MKTPDANYQKRLKHTAPFKGWTFELLVHSEVNANKLGISGLLPKILFYKHVKWFKTFDDKIKALIESKDSKICFCNKFIICRLNMYLKVFIKLSEIKFFMLNSKFCYNK